MFFHQFSLRFFSPLPRRLDFQDRICDGFAARYSKELLVPPRFRLGFRGMETSGFNML